MQAAQASDAAGGACGKSVELLEGKGSARFYLMPESHRTISQQRCSRLGHRSRLHLRFRRRRRHRRRRFYRCAV
eukprot:6204986-Pleurochrysis_carterae.AAC.3